MKWYKYDIRELSDLEYHKWYSLMSKEKQKRVDRFRFEDDKKRTVTGEMLARLAIAEWCSVNPESIKIGEGKYGKPYAVNQNVKFNISHSGDLVVCAVDSQSVGIDIEQIRPLNLSVAKHFCAPDELIYIFNHEPTDTDFVYSEDQDILLRFFEIWTIKEAIGKCLGSGIVSYDGNTHISNQFYIFDGQYIITIVSKSF